MTNWEKFIHDLCGGDEEKIQRLQERIGYILLTPALEEARSSK